MEDWVIAWQISHRNYHQEIGSKSKSGATWVLYVYLFICFKEQRLLLVHNLEVCAGREEVFIHGNSWKKTQTSVPFTIAQTMLTCYRLWNSSKPRLSSVDLANAPPSPSRTPLSISWSWSRRTEGCFLPLSHKGGQGTSVVLNSGLYNDPAWTMGTVMKWMLHFLSPKFNQQCSIQLQSLRLSLSELALVWAKRLRCICPWPWVRESYSPATLALFSM